MNFCLSQYPSGCQFLSSAPQSDPNLLKLSFTSARLRWDSGFSSAQQTHLGNSHLRAQLHGVHMAVTSSGQARRFLSSACKDCGDIRVTGEEMGIKPQSCAAVSGQEVAIPSDVPAKLKV